MGFSTFGAQDRPQKKRRYNPAVDTVTSVAQPLSGPQAAPTGSNSTPLGNHSSMSKGEPGAQANADEIDLDDEKDRHESTPQERSGETAPQAHPLHHGLPARPAPGTDSAGSPMQSPGRHGVSQTGGSTVWYEGYYDSTSNENPWERLERRMGLESMGTWVARQAHPAPGV
ncbi:hypothetical protein J3459_006437 [Metarhizium acridum]|nr:hypothetical protein J3459_006437 [Metarhizium acridum]